MNRKSRVEQYGALTSLALISALALSACGDSDDQDDEPDAPEQNPESEASEAGDDSDQSEDDSDRADPVEPSDRETHEVGGAEPRLVVSYDGGVAVLDGVSLEVLGEAETQGFVRVNAVGDGRHAFVTEGDSFRLVDTGTWGEPHGGHNHYYTTDPIFTDITLEGDSPAHVVSHGPIGTVFFDGSGEYHWFELAELDAETEIDTESAVSEGPHHGVAVVLEDGSRLVTLEDRSGAEFINAEGEVTDRNESCPGVHGEASGPDGLLALGCEDGVLILHGDHFHKVDAEADYARIGNLFSAEGSSIFLGDYTEDENGDEPQTQIALVDAASEQIQLVELDSPYNYSTLARGPQGEAVVLTEDGQVHVIDAETGEHLDHFEVLGEWTTPQDWQQASPALIASGDLLYITDPDQQQIHVLDMTSGEVLTTAELGFAPQELVVADGRPAAGADEFEGDHDDDHDH